MSLTPIPYSEFVAHGSLLLENGGPWSCVGLTNGPCQQVNASWTDNQPSIYSYLNTSHLTGNYSMFLQTSISFNSTEFGDSDSLSYWYLTAVARGDAAVGGLQLDSLVGDDLFIDHMEVQTSADNSSWANVRSFLHAGLLPIDSSNSLRLLNISIYISPLHTGGESMEIDLRGLSLLLGLSSPITLSNGTSPISPTTTSSTGTASNSSASAITPKANSVTLIFIVAGSVIGGISLILLILALLYIRKRRKGAEIVDTSQAGHRDSIDTNVIRTDHSTKNRKNRAGMKIQNVRDPSPLIINRDIEDLDLSKEEAVVTPFYVTTSEQPLANHPTHSKPVIFPRMQSDLLPRRISSTVVEEVTSASPHAYPPAPSSAFITILPPRIPRSNNSQTRRRSLKKSRPGPNPGFEMVTSPIDSSMPTPTALVPSTSQALHPENMTGHIPILAPYHQVPRSRPSATPHDGGNRQGGESARSANNRSSREQARHRDRSRRRGNATARDDGLPSYVENSSRPTLSDDRVGVAV